LTADLKAEYHTIISIPGKVEGEVKHVMAFAKEEVGGAVEMMSKLKLGALHVLHDAANLESKVFALAKNAGGEVDEIVKFMRNEAGGVMTKFSGSLHAFEHEITGFIDGAKSKFEDWEKVADKFASPKAIYEAIMPKFLKLEEENALLKAQLQAVYTKLNMTWDATNGISDGPVKIEGSVVIKGSLTIED
jgi:hypothetical protein